MCENPIPDPQSCKHFLDFKPTSREQKDFKKKFHLYKFTKLVELCPNTLFRRKELFK